MRTTPDGTGNIRAVITVNVGTVIKWYHKPERHGPGWQGDGITSAHPAVPGRLKEEAGPAAETTLRRHGTALNVEAGRCGGSAPVLSDFFIEKKRATRRNVMSP